MFVTCSLGVPSLAIKRPGREADHSPPVSGEVKERMKLCTFAPQYVFMGWCLVKHRDNFTYSLYIVMMDIVCYKIKLSLWLTKHHAVKAYGGVEI
jgi:hypothetical protein